MPQLLIRIPGSPDQVVAVEGHRTIGGGPTADVRIEALGTATLSVRRVSGGAVLESNVVLTSARHRVPAGEPRLLCAGDRADADGFAVELAPDPEPEGTRALARALLAGDEARPPGGPWVVVLQGADAGRRFAVGGALVIGRGARCDVFLSDPRVSRRHLRLEVRGGRLVAIDLRSKNGVTVNERGRRRARLRSGDTLRLGGTLLLVAHAGVTARETASADGAASGSRLPEPASGEVRARGMSAANAAAIAFASAALLGAALLLVRAAA